jgi:glutathione S-transferase
MDIMEARIIKLESVTEKILERLSAVERDVAVIRSNYVTKADLAEVQATLQASIAALEANMTALEARMLKWFIGTAITLAGLAFAAARWIH